MLNTPRSLALSLFGSTSATSARSTATYMPNPRPPRAMPTRKPSKLVAAATTNIATPYTTEAVSTKIFRRPARSDRRPPIRDAATTRTDWTSVARKICRGTSSSALPIFSSR